MNTIFKSKINILKQLSEKLKNGIDVCVDQAVLELLIKIQKLRGQLKCWRHVEFDFVLVEFPG